MCPQRIGNGRRPVQRLLCPGKQGPTTSQTDFHGDNRLRVGRVAAASTLPTLGNGSSSGEEFPLPLHRSREIDARNIQDWEKGAHATAGARLRRGAAEEGEGGGGWTPTYFTQARKRQKRDDIQMGAATLARVTGGGYDHRDGGHARRKRLFAGRRQACEQSRTTPVGKQGRRPYRT